jgi:hypothetical protein
VRSRVPADRPASRGLDFTRRRTRRLPCNPTKIRSAAVASQVNSETGIVERVAAVSDAIPPDGLRPRRRRRTVAGGAQRHGPAADIKPDGTAAAFFFLPQHVRAERAIDACLIAFIGLRVRPEPGDDIGIEPKRQLLILHSMSRSGLRTRAPFAAGSSTIAPRSLAPCPEGHAAASVGIGKLCHKW